MVVKYGAGGKIRAEVKVEAKEGKIKVTSSKDIEKKKKVAHE